MLDIRKVTKSYADCTPLQDVDLRIEQGEFVAITGPSGSGKTTLLNVTAGLLNPTQGDVMIDGVSLYTLNQRERVAYRRQHFGFVFQAFNLVPYLTARENIEVPLYLAGLGRAEQTSRSKELLARVGMNDAGNRYPAQLSIGEQQRVAVARALANNPRVIFADEPTGNLDEANGREVIGYLEGLHQDGVTILLVTHDSRMANRAQRQVKLVDGRIL